MILLASSWCRSSLLIAFDTVTCRGFADDPPLRAPLGRASLVPSMMPIRRNTDVERESDAHCSRRVSLSSMHGDIEDARAVCLEVKVLHKHSGALLITLR